MQAWLVFLIMVVGGIILYLNQLSKKIKKLESDVRELKAGGIQDDFKPVKPPESKPIIKITHTPPPATKSIRISKESNISKVQKTPIKSSRTRSEWESLIGGKWLNWIGALALIISVGFFLKYAIDKNWISESVRVFIGAGIGSGLLVLGGYFYKRKFDVFAQGIIGAGISILYLSVYASFNYYHLVSQAVAFFMMSIATVVGFIVAIRYNSQTISILSWLGGFLTPFLLSSGEANEVSLFLYIILFDLGVLLIVLNKEKWWILEPLLLASTYLTYSAWYGEDYQEASHISVIVFLSLIWLLFNALEFYRLLKAKEYNIEIRSSVTVFNTLLFYVMLYIVVDLIYHEYMGLVTFFIAIVYLTGFLILRRKQPANQMAHIIFALSSILLIMIASSIQFSDFMMIGFWVLEVLILAWIGTHWNLRYIWYAALGLLVVTCIQLILTKNMLAYNDFDSYMLMLNPRSYATSFTIFVIFFMATLSKHHEIPSISQIRSVLQYAGSILLLIFLSIETIDFFRILSLNGGTEEIEWYTATKFLALAIVWILYALVFIRIGLQTLYEPLLFCGIAASLLAIVEVLVRSLFDYQPIEQFVFILNERAFSFGLIIVAMVLISMWLSKNSERYSWISDLVNISRIALLVLILMLITSEIRDLFSNKMSLLTDSSSDTDLANLQQLSLSGAWLFYSIILMVIGLWRRQQTIRISSIVLFGLSVLKIFIYDLSFLETPYRIVSFLILGILLLTVSYLYNRYKEVILGEKEKT